MRMNNVHASQRSISGLDNKSQIKAVLESIGSRKMENWKATAVAHPNIAFIKYWGNRDSELRLPDNGSISMNLGNLATRTTVAFDKNLERDNVSIQGRPADENGSRRVSRHLDLLRERAGLAWKARVESENSFPMGAGIASSASAFAALTLSAARALDLRLSEKELSMLARRGSGSACRSIPEGYVEWYAADRDAGSFAESFAAPDHWDLVDLIAIVSAAPKRVSSEEGNRLASTSPFQRARVEDSARRLAVCRTAIQTKDFDLLAEAVEEDTRLMHSVMMTSHPAMFYWQGATIDLLQEIPNWRRVGLAVAYSVDAGPNVHCLCLPEAAEEIRRRLIGMDGIQDVLISRAGAGAKILEE
jgi:diphosphomevalonate decarboxylase